MIIENKCSINGTIRNSVSVTYRGATEALFPVDNPEESDAVLLTLFSFAFSLQAGRKTQIQIYIINSFP